MVDRDRVPVTVLLTVGDQAELLTPGHDASAALRAPVAVIAEDADLPVYELPVAGSLQFGTAGDTATSR